MEIKEIEIYGKTKIVGYQYTCPYCFSENHLKVDAFDYESMRNYGVDVVCEDCGNTSKVIGIDYD
jgi:hypothetical protein